MMVDIVYIFCHIFEMLHIPESAYRIANGRYILWDFYIVVADSFKVEAHKSKRYAEIAYRRKYDRIFGFKYLVYVWQYFAQ